MSQTTDNDPQQEVTSPASQTEVAEATSSVEATEDKTPEGPANGDAEAAATPSEAEAEASPAADEAAAEEPKPEAEAEPDDATAPAEPETETKTETETETETKAKADDKADEQPAPIEKKAETETKADQEPAPVEKKTETAAEAKTEAKATEKADASSKPDAKSKPGAAAQKPAPKAGAKNKKSDPVLDERHQAALAPIVEAFEKKTPLEGKVIGWNKGGFHVALGSIAAFCPVSQIEAGNPRSPKRYVDRAFDFMIFEIEKGGRRVVVSRAAALKAERDERAAKVRKNFKVGDKIDGAVSSLTDFGAFVTIDDGIEGLVHVSEISRQRVEHPKERLKVGQKVRVQVLKIEKQGNRVSLSMKRLEKDPWKSIAERFPAGEPFTGTIKRKAEFGLFVEVEPGIEGLVHTSRLPLGDSMDNEKYAEGQKVEGWVQDVEPKRRRLALSLREVPNPEAWNDAEKNFPVGSIVKGQVERVAKFGAFIMLAPGLTGLLPFSELNQGANVNLKRQYHTGKEVSVRVLSIDRGKRRISLGTEASKAVGTTADYKDFQARQKKAVESAPMSALAAAFAKIGE